MNFVELVNRFFILVPRNMNKRRKLSTTDNER